MTARERDFCLEILLCLGMKKISILLPFWIIVTAAFGQDSVKTTTPVEPIYVVVDERAQFPGGIAELSRYLNNNVRFPRGAGKGGKVYITFIVSKEGSIIDDSIKVVPMQKLISTHVNTDNVTEEKPFVDEGIRLIKNMPDWIPARLKNMPVASKFVMPITIRRD
jgi:hypothetical protein